MSEETVTIPKRIYAGTIARLKQLENILRAIEFEGEFSCCPVCGHEAPETVTGEPIHEEDCALNRVLRGWQ